MSSLPLTAQALPETAPWWPWPLALLLWLALLWGVGFLLAAPHPVAPPPAPLDAQLVELPPPPKLQAMTPPPPQPVHTIMPRSVTPPAKSVAQPTAPLPKVALATPPPADPRPAKAEPAPPSPPPVTPVANESAGTQQMGARALYQPKPELPEALRDQSMHIVVRVRIHIAADGSLQIELIKPAPDPRINQLVLNTLKTWRFFPALQAGKPVASVQDVNVAFDVN